MISAFEMAPCEPSAVVPAQMFGGTRWDCDTSGPRALMLAVLEDALRCIEEGRWRSHFRARRLAAEAEAWVRCERREWPFSFVNICEVLGFDVDAMRAHLLTSPRDAAHRRHTRRKKHPSAPACIRPRGSDVAAMPMQQQPRASGERSRRCTASSPRMDPRRVRGDEPTRAANLKEDVPCIFDVPRRSPACPTSP